MLQPEERYPTHLVPGFRLAPLSAGYPAGMGAPPATPGPDDMSPCSPYPGLDGGADGQAKAGGAGAGDVDGLKDKWGFLPGMDDTMEVSHGECRACGR